MTMAKADTMPPVSVIPHQETVTTSAMQRYRYKMKMENLTKEVVTHLCGDSYGQLKKIYKKGAHISVIDKMLKFLSNQTFLSVQLKNTMRQMSFVHSSESIRQQRGFVSVLSMELVMGLLLDFHRSSTPLSSVQWLSIRRYKLQEGKRGNGRYTMFHWEQKGTEVGSHREGYVENWSYGVRSLQTNTIVMIDKFARDILRFVDHSCASKSDFEVDEKWAIFPGAVQTIEPYNQIVHRDMGERNGYIVHVPLTREGMVLLVLPGRSAPGTGLTKRLCKEPIGQPLFIPFGAYLVLPSHVNHSGVYGHAGNMRFHMSLRLRNDGDWGCDKLAADRTALDYNKKHSNFSNEYWQKEMENGELEYSAFVKAYIESMENRFGMLFDRRLILCSPTS